MPSRKQTPTQRTSQSPANKSPADQSRDNPGAARVAAEVTRDAGSGTVRQDAKVTGGDADVTASQETDAEGAMLSQSAAADTGAAGAAAAEPAPSSSSADAFDSSPTGLLPGEAVMEEARTARKTLRRVATPLRPRTQLQGLLREAAQDPALRDRLRSDPRAVLAEVGITVPASVSLEVHENGPTRLHLIIPADPATLPESTDGAEVAPATRTARNIFEICQGELTDEMVDVGSMTNTGNNNTNTVHVYKPTIIMNF